ncbi:insulinase family protein [Actinoplanes sp. NPDC051861]|uniref:insulinase family protein n=1 Tax=Actinoplanes sp. NPDC051861 TaxID=3155170 RepID=UPI003439692C
MIKQLEVDGVPALLAPVTGTTHAGLVFRVGLADEPPARRGITHLIQHLVLDGHRNGRVGAEHTYFHVQGSAERIAEFVTGVCAALRRLPTDRIDAEKKVLRSEDQPVGPLPTRRHGARDFGMAGYPEWGLAGLGAEHLNEWIARYFTRENAVLWVAGDAVPQGLALDLAEGERQPPPAPSAALAATPAWFAGPGEEVAWDTVVRREARAAVFANVLERRLHRDLCLRSEIAARVGTEYQPRAGRTARITAVAEPLPERAGAALGGTIDALAEMRAGRIEPDDVATVVELTCRGLREAERKGGRLPGQAFNVLAGLSVRSLDDAVTEASAVTVAEVAAVAATAYEAGLLMTPAGTSADWGGYPAASLPSSPISGRTLRARGNRSLRLVYSDEGVTVVGGGTVLYDTCAALLVGPDGSRELVGEDGAAVRVDPAAFRGGAALIEQIDARVPARVRVDLRSAESEADITDAR